MNSTEIKKENKMANTPMLKLILTMSMPAIISMFIQSLYNIVDSLFVARIGEDALNALSLAFPIQMLMIAMAVGTGIGVNSLIARSLGQKQYKKANDTAEHGVLLAFISWLIFAFFGLFFTRVFFEFSTTNKTVIEMGVSYISIVTICSLGLFMQIIIEKIFQGTGNMMYPMCTQIVGAVINIILDPILIFGWFGMPKMGVTGAALATVIGQGIAMLMCVALLIKGPKEIDLKIKGFKLKWDVIKAIYAVGLPSIIMQSIMSAVVIMLNQILVGFSEAAVSVLGIYFRIQSFIFMPVFGLNQGALPIMGYSYGARNKERLLSCVKIAGIIATSIMFLGTVLFNRFAYEMIGVFEPTQEMLHIGVSALRIISIGFVFAGISIIISTFFQAIGDGFKSLLISIVRQIGVLLPAAWLLSKSFGVIGVWLAFPIAEGVAIIGSIVMLIMQYRRKIVHLEVE